MDLSCLIKVVAIVASLAEDTIRELGMKKWVERDK